MIKIALKQNLAKEIKIDDTHSIVIEYPSIEQKQILDEILLTITLLDEELKKVKNPVELAKINAKKISLMHEFMKLTIRFCLKQVKGYDFNLELEGNQLDDKTFEAICYDVKQVTSLFELISKEIEFNELDKKK